MHNKATSKYIIIKYYIGNYYCNVIILLIRCGGPCLSALLLVSSTVHTEKRNKFHLI